MRRFDAKALYEALEQKRVERAITWAQVANETQVSEATLRRTRDGGRLEVDGMLAMVGWLGVAVEMFVRETDR